MNQTTISTGRLKLVKVYLGGLEKNKHRDKKLNEGRGTVGKTAVAGTKDRETNEVRALTVENTVAKTLQVFIADNVSQDASIYTEDSTAYSNLPLDHGSVKHSVGEYMKEQAHINGVESFWSMLKRAHKGTFHKISPKHLDRYVHEFAGKHNIRNLDTLAQMRDTVARLVGRNLLHRRLIADNGLSSQARSQQRPCQRFRRCAFQVFFRVEFRFVFHCIALHSDMVFPPLLRLQPEQSS